MKRELTEEEKNICIKQLDSILEQNEYLEYGMKIYQLQLEKGLELDYQKRIKQTKQELTNTKQQLELNNSIISTLKDQLEKGVEIKEKKEESEEEIEVEE